MGELDFTDPANQPGGAVVAPVALVGDDNTVPLTVTGGPLGSTDVLDINAAVGQVALQVRNSGALVVQTYNGALTVIRALLSTSTSGIVSLTSNDAAGVPAAIVTVSPGLIELGDGSVDWVTAIPSGLVISGSHAAPADGALSAGECALWFDQTNGAGNTKLMVKGKSADGTVKTATILLA